MKYRTREEERPHGTSRARAKAQHAIDDKWLILDMLTKSPPIRPDSSYKLRKTDPNRPMTEYFQRAVKNLTNFEIDNVLECKTQITHDERQLWMLATE
jgi:1,2-phenylacetyl-CoA epoxidase catalytic subunit